MSTGKYSGTIRSLLKNAVDKGLCSSVEYEMLLDDILKTKKAKVLVFGTGVDCLLWLAANASGHTWFIEDDPVWFNRWSILPNIVRVEYASWLLDKDVIHPNETLKMSFPEPIEQSDWDIIFVDGPVGSVQGRMKSIFNAHRLAGDNTRVYIHDYDRETEKMYADHFFSKVHVTERMAMCQK